MPSRVKISNERDLTQNCRVHDSSRVLYSLSYVLLLVSPTRPGEPEPIADARIGDVTQTRDGFQLAGVDVPAFVEHVFSNVDVLDESEDKCRCLRTAHRVGDVDNLEELWAQ